MTNKTNIDRMRQGYTAFSAGDLETLRALFAPDIVWHSGGDNPLTGDYKGIDEVFGFFGQLFQLTGGDFSQHIHDLLANDEHAVAMTTVRASRPDGRTMEMPQIAVFHMDDQHRVTEAWVIPTDSVAANAFFL